MMPKPQLTEEEIEERDLWIESEDLPEGKDGIKTLAKHNRHTKQDLKEIEKHFRKIERREIKTLKWDIETGKKILSDVTEEDFINVVRLDRPWTSENLQQVWDREVCPNEPTFIFADQFGSDEDVN